eukprot:3280109-Pyramimonas_sp.AAC.1
MDSVRGHRWMELHLGVRCFRPIPPPNATLLVFLPQLRPTECRTSPTALTTRELPENVVAKTGFKTVELDWNPCGHPPL